MNDEQVLNDFARALIPSEENSFKSNMQKEFWNPSEFSALAAGLDPKTYKAGRAIELSDNEFVKRAKKANWIHRKLIDDIEKELWRWQQFLVISGGHMYASRWMYLKWAAETGIILSDLFFNALPPSLMQLYFEFGSINTALRTENMSSQRYHKAYYLKQAECLIKQEGKIPPTKIYEHSYMQNVQRYIRELGGNYSKRTITENWLTEICDCTIGRPKILS
jgi:hypothetical protein